LERGLEEELREIWIGLELENPAIGRLNLEAVLTSGAPCFCVFVFFVFYL
jgi:hypothetical protein